MEALTIPCGKWLPAAGGSGRRTSISPGVRGAAARAGSPGALLSLQAPSGIHHGSFSPVFSWRGGRAITTVAPAFTRRSPAFPSAEKPEKAEAESETSKSTQTASELLQTVAQSQVAEIQNQTTDQFPTEVAKKQSAEVGQVAEIQNQTTDQFPTEVAEKQSAEVGQTQAATDQLLKADTEIETAQETTQVQTQTSSEPLQSNPEIETVQVKAQIPDVSRTVLVKFMLQKSCKFGEQFLLVGEDPTLGSWDPASATPLAWSDGDVWTGVTTLPAGEEIKFKFILKARSGKIKWQPGLDRVLQTWDTTNTIVIAGDWEDAVDLKITEEGPLETPAEGETSEESKITGAHGEDVIEKSQAVINTDESEQEKAEFAVVMPTGLEGDPVLVPGLASLPLASTQGASSSEEVTNGIVDSASSSTFGELGSKTSKVNVW